MPHIRQHAQLTVPHSMPSSLLCLHQTKVFIKAIVQVPRPANHPIEQLGLHSGQGYSLRTAPCDASSVCGDKPLASHDANAWSPHITCIPSSSCRTIRKSRTIPTPFVDLPNRQPTGRPSSADVPNYKTLQFADCTNTTLQLTQWWKYKNVLNIINKYTIRRMLYLFIIFRMCLHFHQVVIYGWNVQLV